MSQLSQNPDSLQSTASKIISSEVVTVTPSVAKTWLDLMIGNQRRPSEKVVNRYAKAMKSGQWSLGSAISFCSEGFLIDGQHRLLAVAKSGCNIDFIVIRGLPSNAIYGIDMGMPRSSVNLASLEGLSVTSIHLSILNCCFFGFDSDGLPPSLSKFDQVEALKKHFDAIEFACKRFNANGRITYAPFLAPVAKAYYSENHLRLEQFLKVLHTGFPVSANAEEDSAAISLRNLYFKERNLVAMRLNNGSTKRMHDYRKATTVLKNFILRKPLKLIKETTSNIFPVKDFDAWWKDKAA
ncbi:hypothetical protein [Phormidium tenue]|uniref:Uncharacterized protein n=1 Tax=Phormidium tenue FACHB-1050 TaxID=2692857 RepID=A0ABR8C930_9CYAN|nr:hypothetical protein [Phormidium tenue]MBD2316670.1 hypothetical protein [Phormidium tenue FACHB-1050]